MLLVTFKFLLIVVNFDTFTTLLVTCYYLLIFVMEQINLQTFYGNTYIHDIILAKISKNCVCVLLESCHIDKLLQNSFRGP